MEQQQKFMRAALLEAKKAAKEGEVPVGCVIVKDGQIIARGRNKREKTQCATRHAEMIAVERACKKVGFWRLVGCEIYVTLEPCPMCAGALVNSRMDKLYFGAYDQKAGASETLYRITDDPRLNHRLQVHGGVMEQPCREVLTEFFRNIRKNAT